MTNKALPAAYLAIEREAEQLGFLLSEGSRKRFHSGVAASSLTSIRRGRLRGGSEIGCPPEREQEASQRTAAATIVVAVATNRIGLQLIPCTFGVPITGNS